MFIGLVSMQALLGEEKEPNKPRKRGRKTGRGTATDWAFCTEGSCHVGQGDCDFNSDCKEGLRCGRDNCKDFHSDAHRSADCCEPEKWVRYASTDCYSGRGATTIFPNPWETNTSLRSCQNLCDLTDECEGFIWGKRPNEKRPSCNLRKNISVGECQKNSRWTLYKKNSPTLAWKAHTATDCYTGRGATTIQPNPWEVNGSLESCQTACLQKADCTGFIWGKRPSENSPSCNLRKNIDVQKCQKNTRWTLYEKTSAAWMAFGSTDCYSGRGATTIFPNPWETNGSLYSCARACGSKSGCEGFIWGKRANEKSPSCNLRGNIVRENCNNNNPGWALFQRF